MFGRYFCLFIENTLQYHCKSKYNHLYFENIIKSSKHILVYDGEVLLLQSIFLKGFLKIWWWFSFIWKV